MGAGGLGDGGDRRQAHVQAGGDVETGFKRLADRIDPVFGQNAARVDHADNESLGAGGNRVRDRHIGNSEIGAAVLKAQLAEAPVRPPVDDALGGLGAELVRHVSQEQEIRVFDFHAPLPVGADIAGVAGTKRRPPDDQVGRPFNCLVAIC